VSQLPHAKMLFGFAVINEVESATQLLASGLNQVIDPGWFVRESASAFTCLASGVERVMKLTYGLDVLNGSGAFPSEPELRKLGHNLVKLDGIVFPRLVGHATEAGNAYVEQLLNDAQADPYWPGILAALNAWAAASGRYRDLDFLTGKTAVDDPPWALWEETEQECVDDLGLLSALAGPNNRSALVVVRTRLAESVMKWWFAVYRSWLHGLVGTDQKSPATSLAPASTVQLAKPLARLVKGL
jgi:hypothetical protein